MGSRQYAQRSNKVHSPDGNCAVDPESNWFKFEQAMVVHREEKKKKV